VYSSTEGAEQDGAREVSDALTGALEHLLTLKNGPFQKAFAEIDMRFSEQADLNDELLGRVQGLEEENTALREQLKGVSLAEEIARLEQANGMLADHLLSEQTQRHKETEEINDTLQKLTVFVRSLDTDYARKRRHQRHATANNIMARFKHGSRAKAWSKWLHVTAHRRKVAMQKKRAMARFINRNLCVTFQTWQSQVRMWIKQRLHGPLERLQEQVAAQAEAQARVREPCLPCQVGVA
jgi:hypothetical protein